MATSTTRPAAPGAAGRVAVPSPRTGVPLAATLVVGAVLAVVATLVGIALSGAATPTVLADPGALVRWGLPVADVVVQVAATVTIGALVLAAVVLPRRTTSSAAGADSWAFAQRTAAVASVVWTAALVVQLLGTYARVSGQPIGGENFGAELGVFLTQIELGQAMLWALLLTALTSLIAVAANGYVSALTAAIVSLAALAPVAQTGHAAGAANHTLAVGSLWLHLAGVTVWIGGLAVLALVAGRLGRDVVAAATRFSRTAVWAYALVAVSGVVSAWIRMGSLRDLGTAYGVLLILKVAAVVALGAAGCWHRRRTIPALTGAHRAGRSRSGGSSPSRSSSPARRWASPRRCRTRHRRCRTPCRRTSAPPRRSRARPCRPSRRCWAGSRASPLTCWC
ncbi:copper resistance D family protein [Litorihabitans aurantiacus]|uniref:Copper resistance protein D domain-containing protein n=1 Tax=Litorihabitans aurantiacus TaxID=1930061 RepID=A0AA38CVD9_9MICO|nr:CopD family protein [Litorihabitans aurantiacus]GMA32785.1 hypothetical protein GCM10025875_27770 [Litorihabitans aurantiacus]